MSLLQDKIIIIAGGSGLIGRAIVDHARKEGATVINADIAAQNNLEHGEYQFDIASEDSVNKLSDAVVKQYGRIDGFVTCVYPHTADHRLPFEEMPADTWKKNVDLHLNGFALCAKIILRQMRKQKSGSFVNIGSIYGVVGPDYSIYEGNEGLASPVVYGAIKGGIIQMTRHLASFYGGHGVRVNTVSPGGIFDSHDKAFVERYQRKTMLKRMGVPKDIAGPVAFLLSDDAAYITGHNLMVDGGFVAM